MQLFWYCRYCGFKEGKWADAIDIFESEMPDREKAIEAFRIKWAQLYVCHCCGVRGRMSDADAPIKVTKEASHKYWRELQTDVTFKPPS